MVRLTPIATALVLLSTVSAQDGPPPALVTTAPVTEATISETVSLLGTVRPVMDSLVAAEVNGRVAERHVENGDTVARGATLVLLDATRLQQLLDQALAERSEIEALLELAKRQELRAEELHEDAILAQGDVDAVRSRRQSLEGRIRAVEARIASTEDDVGRTRVRAPFAGVVTEVRIEVGEWIRQGDAAVRLSKLDPLEIQVDIPENYFPRLSKGDPVSATIDALPGLSLDGEVFRLVPMADSEARTFPLLIRADNPEGRVAAGMLARVELALGTSSRVLLVPKDAIVRQAMSEVVFVVESDVVRSVAVKSGRASGNRVEISGELAPGDAVVVRGNERLTPGQQVLVDSPGANADARAGN